MRNNKIFSCRDIGLLYNINSPNHLRYNFVHTAFCVPPQQYFLVETIFNCNGIEQLISIFSIFIVAANSVLLLV